MWERFPTTDTSKCNSKNILLIKFCVGKIFNNKCQSSSSFQAVRLHLLRSFFLKFTFGWELKNKNALTVKCWKKRMSPWRFRMYKRVSFTNGVIGLKFFLKSGVKMVFKKIEKTRFSKGNKNHSCRLSFISLLINSHSVLLYETFWRTVLQQLR